MVDRSNKVFLGTHWVCRYLPRNTSAVSAQDAPLVSVEGSRSTRR
jgi:hypothetical protein